MKKILVFLAVYLGMVLFSFLYYLGTTGDLKTDLQNIIRVALIGPPINHESEE